jgi:leucyl-tRNA synthetase
MLYHPESVEPKWQKRWEKEKCFEVPQDVKALAGKPKFYVLDMFPYPSGAGLHVGHPEGYTATDVVARYKRMRGFAVLHPMGWDAFGLPAERAAMRENIHPAIITKKNVDNFRRQIKRLGFSYDWQREVDTSSVDFYRWTQWIFLKLHEKGLAYLAEVPVNWCPALGTVLANEEVKDGKYVETGDPVERRSMRQWMLKITAYAERLLKDLDEVDWPEGVKEMQREWIGKSTGAEIDFALENVADKVSVFTTRPDTLMGVTYVVVAPEHPLVDKITTAAQKSAVEKYITIARNRTDLQRTDLAKEKTGVFTGAFAVHPVSGQRLPVWVADYVLMSYGTGCVMAVPAHDERDHEFAKAYRLPLVQVIDGAKESIETAAHTGSGTLVNSAAFTGLASEAAKIAITEWLEKNSKGKARTTYRLRDWLFSRQRYWGEPFPILHAEDGEIIPVPEADLPVELPAVDAYRPTDDGHPPLGRASDDWLVVTLPDGRQARRETNTMPQWAGSCWYYLRYMDPKNQNAAWSKEAEQYWMPVDLYVGGVEHAVLHLLYARFWHKVLYDCGLVHTKEPFQKLFNQGMILAQSYRDDAGKYYSPEDVEHREKKYFVKGSGTELHAQVEKMSKSKLNVVNPDDVIRDYGADAMRLYELFMGPLEQVKPWNMEGVEGVYRFLHRVWRLVVDPQTGNLNALIQKVPGASEPSLWKTLHKTVQKVEQDTEKLCFNTAISQMMIFVNEATGAKTLPQETLELFLQVLAPYAPHLAEELWEKLGHRDLVCKRTWPQYEMGLVTDSSVTIIIQVNGKLRDKFEAPRDSAEPELQRLALESAKVQEVLLGATPKRVIVVKNRLVNIVL